MVAEIIIISIIILLVLAGGAAVNKKKKQDLKNLNNSESEIKITQPKNGMIP